MAEIIKLPLTWGIVVTILSVAVGGGAMGFQVTSQAKTIDSLVKKVEIIQISCNRIGYRVDSIEPRLERLENASQYRVNPGP